VDLTTRLNRFAHSMDEPVAVVELNGLLEQMVLLLQRMARLRKVQLEAVTTATAVKLRTDPFQLQLLITACVEQLLQQVAAGASIRLRHEPRGEKVAIVVETSGADEPPGLSAASLAAAFADLTEILGRLGAAIQLLEDAGGRGIGLSLPLDMP
jgi:C4-dicarboxylate-specific signal transduction histidine kinase